MYKGYLKGNGKHAASKFKDGTKLLSYHTARKHDSFVGILDDNYIMVDIDDIDEAEMLLDIIEDKNIRCSVLETTNGMHFYFKGYDITANKIKWFSNIGLLCDYKLGIKNTADPLKINGETRRWLRKSNEHDPLPSWLYPYNKKNPNLTKMTEGDGRNDKLFTYILKLQSQGMAKNDIKETISIINNYILEEPVEQNELNIILRDEAFMKESFYIKGAFQHEKFGGFLINEHHICKITNILHIYKDGVYSDKQEDIEEAMIKHIPALKRMQRQETLAYLQLKAKHKNFASTKYVVVKNGVFNLETWQLEDFTPEIITRNKIPVAYIPDAYYKVTDKTLNKMAVNDKTIRSILEEILGYILFRRNEFAATFILTGNGSNGKSSYLKIIRQLVGEENTSSLDLKELDQRFKTAELFGKLANIGDDIGKGYIKESSVFKKLSTGETLNVERKGKDPFDFTNYAKLIFSANEMPRINDFTDGLGRRLQIVPFKAKFTPDDEDYDPFITDKLLSNESMQYVLILALNSLKRLLEEKKFTKSKAVEEELVKYQEENNPIISFVNNENIELERSVVGDVYLQYKVYCAENGFQSVSNINFSKQISQLFGYKSHVQRVDGKNKRLFINNE
ncbi:MULTISPECIES: DNA primase family protein [Bacillus cereus group]|uniref:Phage/plasmid primase, P4 family n=2 Tax=Bacillus cereus group TaxID=86661 RepID=A0AAW5L7S5_BACCE|nr:MULTISPECIES: DNA primase family protein [Bacillus cereus group]MCQ6288085.1 phage/plasmid primase, P4 family [Bacillus cereus]MCQ6305520.1 phage/plasmid primase, P4 family [Bacillus cereus]MCQ6317341.1 phage/plasmid primase, P4 family [Bacillus cereus]MCQ6329295.1 phage/plasmid primase, P4 family [Bacillus cereus]MCQ6385267.1 phage/plasmid primase, P4 family [Bacillus cereus]